MFFRVIMLVVSLYFFVSDICYAFDGRSKPILFQLFNFGFLAWWTYSIIFYTRSIWNLLA